MNGGIYSVNDETWVRGNDFCSVSVEVLHVNDGTFQIVLLRHRAHAAIHIDGRAGDIGSSI